MLPNKAEALDIRATAEFMGTTEKTIRARIARGVLPYKKLGGRLFCLKTELLKYLSELPGISVEQARRNAGIEA